MAQFKFLISGIAAALLTINVTLAGNLSDQEHRDLNSAHSALQNGSFERAIEILAPLYESHPQNVEITNNFAVALFNSGRTADAGLLLQDYLQSHDQVGVPSNNLFQVYDFLAAESYGMLSGNVPQQPELAIVPPTPAPTSASVEISTAEKNLPKQTPVVMTSTEQASAEMSEIEQRLQEYVNAWSDGDLDAYLSYYYPDRSPIRGQRYSNWKEERGSKIYPERNISVSVSDLQVMPVDDSQAIAVYRQLYSARNYTDETTKQLTWVKDNGEWYIRYEMALPN